jgi:hypothetical protein
MLPGPRIVLVAIAATFAFVVLAFAQLVKLQVAQSHSASFGPVEARFAGLAFAERADWTPVATARARSMEALAPFGNLPSMQPRRPDREAASAPMPIQIAALERPATVSDAPAITLAPVTVASVDPTTQSSPPISTPEPASTAHQLPQDALPETAAPETASPETATPETAAPETAAPEAAGGPAQGVSEGTETPVVDIAALTPPPTALTPVIAARGSAEVRVAAIHAPIDPVPAALSVSAPAAAEPPAAAAAPETPKQVASLPDHVASADAEPDLTPTPDPPAAITRLPLPRPAFAALSTEIVPVPTPRPKITLPPGRKVQARPARKRTARRSATPPKPAQPPQPANPFAALFGGNQTSATGRR